MRGAAAILGLLAALVVITITMTGTHVGVETELVSWQSGPLAGTGGKLSICAPSPHPQPSSSHSHLRPQELTGKPSQHLW